MSFLIKKGFLDIKFCSDIISKYHSNINDTSLTNTSTLNTMRELLLKENGWDELIEDIVNQLNYEVSSYLSNFHSKLDLYYFSHAVLWHQKEFNSIPVHYDTEWLPDNSVNPPIRNFGCLIYLNGDFEGGEVIFPLHNTCIKPEPGLLLIFPTSFMFPHMTAPSIGGDRYVIRFNYFVKKDKAYEQYVT